MSRVPSRLRVVVTVEDHVLGTVLCEALQDDGYEAVHFDRVTEARTFVIEHMPDVVLLDLPYEHSPRDPQLRNRTTARPHMSSVSLRTTQETRMAFAERFVDGNKEIENFALAGRELVKFCL